MFSEARNMQAAIGNSSSSPVVLTFLNRTNLRLNSSPATKSASEIYKTQILLERWKSTSPKPSSKTSLIFP